MKNIIVQHKQTRIVLTPEGGVTVERFQANTGWIVDNDLPVTCLMRAALARLETALPKVEQIEREVTP